MPYISPIGRARFAHKLDPLLDYLSICGLQAGDLNYIITKIITSGLKQEDRYYKFNERIGVLECAKLELYRRMCGPYEDKKVIENGDVYPEAE